MSRSYSRWLVASFLFFGACNSKSPETAPETPDVAQGDVAPDTAVPVSPAADLDEPKLAAALPALVESYFSVYDLLQNRPNAHRVLTAGQGLLVDAAQVDFVRYIHGNHPGDWTLQTKLEDVVGAALRKRRKGRLWVPAIPGANRLTVRVYSQAKTNTLKVKVNGKDAGAHALEKGWQTQVFELSEPAGPENRIDLEFTNMGRIAGSLSGGGVAWLVLGTEEASDPPQSTREVTTAQGALTLSGVEDAFWNVWLLGGTKLDLGLEGDVGCGVSVKLDVEDGGSIKTAVSKDIALVEEHGREQSTFVDLSEYQGQVGRLTLAKFGECESVVLKRAQLVVPGERPVAAKIKPPKYVVFWMIDTLRADHVPLHFETDVRAPNIKRLADEGASFKLAYVQGNESKTSHASLFSGMFPNKHRVLGRGHLKPEHYLMPEAIRDAGYMTAAYISNGYVSEPWGFVQGWDMYQNNLRSNYRIDGRSMAKMGVKWASEHKEKPFFLYIGTVDPHVSYRRHDDLIGHYETTPYKGRFEKACYGADLGKIKGGSIKLTPRDKERIHALYKNEVEFNDIAFGELRQGLEEAGIWDQTLVIVTADHGDEFWEHGGVGHGHSVYQEQVHVPLIMYYPPAIAAKTVISAGVDVADVYPTIVEYLGKDRPKDLQGKGLMGIINKVGGDYPEPATATLYLRAYATQMEQWKLYLKKGDYQVYDRAADPTEQKDVAAKHPLVSRWLLDTTGWFRAYRKEWDKQRWGVGSNLAADFPPLAR